MVLLMQPSRGKGNRRLKENRRFLWVSPRTLHPSRVLPERYSSSELVESIRRDGIQQPIIVRPSPHESGMYEIIDGHIRYKSVQQNQKVLVDARHNVDDVEVFKLSETTFKRKPRTTYERSLFYNKWVRTVEASSGGRGAQSKVAREANLSESEVSHYLSINRVFDRLGSQNVSETIFNTLKNQSVNKLYALSKVEDNSVMLEVAAKMGENPKLTLKELKDLIEEQTSPMREIQELLEDDEEDEVDESIRIDEVKKAALELEGTLNQTRKALTAFKSRLVGNPRKFISTDVFKRIRRMLKALKRIEKEANQIIHSGKKASAR